MLKWYSERLITLDGRTWSRWDVLHDLHCGNFIAARRLSYTLLHNDVTSLSVLFHLGLHGLLRIVGVGERGAFVAACLLDSEGYDAFQWFQTDVPHDVSRSKKGAIAKAVARTKAKTRKRGR